MATSSSAPFVPPTTSTPLLAANAANMPSAQLANQVAAVAAAIGNQMPPELPNLLQNYISSQQNQAAVAAAAAGANYVYPPLTALLPYHGAF